LGNWNHTNDIIRKEKKKVCEEATRMQDYELNWRPWMQKSVFLEIEGRHDKKGTREQSILVGRI
jgi:hypothetical protein